MVGFGSQHHNWVAAPDSGAADEGEFPAYAEPIERSDTDYYYDFESDQLRGAWPSKTTPTPASDRWPLKAASSEESEQAQNHYQRQQQQQHLHNEHYGDYGQSQEDYQQYQGQYFQSQGQEDYEPQRKVASDDQYQMLEHSYESGYQELQNAGPQDYNDESSLGSLGTFYSADYSTTLGAKLPTAPPDFDIKKEIHSHAVTGTATTPMPTASESTSLRVRS